MECSDEYKFSLLSFLSIIQDSKRNILYHMQTSENSWLCGCLSSAIVSKYKEKQYNIKYEKGRMADNILITRECI